MSNVSNNVSFIQALNDNITETDIGVQTFALPFQ